MASLLSFSALSYSPFSRQARARQAWASRASFGEFPRQVAEATAFLRAEWEQVQRLCEWPGVEGVTLDFGIERRDVAVQCDRLPAELVRLAGVLGLAIELSQYPPSQAAQHARPRR